MGLSKSPANKLLRSFESKYEYCIFLEEPLSIYEKLPSALDHAGFSRIILPHHTHSNPYYIFYWLLLVDNRIV